MFHQNPLSDQKPWEASSASENSFSEADFSDSDGSFIYGSDDEDSEPEVEKDTQCTSECLKEMNGGTIERTGQHSTEEEARREKKAAKEKGRQLLLASFEFDSTTPQDRYSRLKQLRETTGFTGPAIQQWFNDRQLLLASFAMDQSTPERRSDRMEKLMAATGRNVKSIQLWFRTQRLKSTATEEEIQRMKEQARKGVEVLFASFAADPRSPEEDGTRLAELCEATRFTSQQIQKWFKNRQRSCGYKTFQRRSQKEKAILLAAYNTDPSVPRAGSQRLIDLCAATGGDSLGVRGWFRNWKNHLEKKKKQMATEEGRKAIEDMERRERELKILEECFNKDPRYPYKHSKRLKEICEATGADGKRVQMWYNNRLKIFMKSGKPFSEAKQNEEKEESIERVDEEGHMTIRKEKTAEQREILLASYNEDTNVPSNNSARLEKLCAATGLKRRAVQGWFQNKIKVARHRESEYMKQKAAKKEDWLRRRQIVIDSCSKDSASPKQNSLRMVELVAATGFKPSHIQTMFQIFRKQALERARATLGNDEDRSKSTEKPGSADESDEQGDNNENNLPLEDVKPIPSSSKVSVKSEIIYAPLPPLPIARAKKCPICDLICSEAAVIVECLSKAKEMDEYFGSSMVHFLTHTSAVRICMVHTTEFEKIRMKTISKIEAL